jgi:hypothetical protein
MKQKFSLNENTEGMACMIHVIPLTEKREGKFA